MSEPKVLHEWDERRLLNTKRGITYFDGLALHDLGQIGEELAAEILRLAAESEELKQKLAAEQDQIAVIGRREGER